MKLESAVYTKLQLRQLFDCSNSTIDRWVKDKTIPPPFVRGRWRRAEIDQILWCTNHHLAPLTTTTKEIPGPQNLNRESSTYEH